VTCTQFSEQFKLALKQWSVSAVKQNEQNWVSVTERFPTVCNPAPQNSFNNTVNAILTEGDRINSTAIYWLWSSANTNVYLLAGLVLWLVWIFSLVMIWITNCVYVTDAIRWYIIDSLSLGRSPCGRSIYSCNDCLLSVQILLPETSSQKNN